MYFQGDYRSAGLDRVHNAQWRQRNGVNLEHCIEIYSKPLYPEIENLQSFATAKLYRLDVLGSKTQDL